MKKYCSVIRVIIQTQVDQKMSGVGNAACHAEPPSVGFYYTSLGSRSNAANVFSATVFSLQVTC